MALLLVNHDGSVAIDEASKSLKKKTPLLDVVEQAIRQVEADVSIKVVGFGGYPNALGQMELDAGIMDGTSRKTGSVGAVNSCPHPISLARKVMELLPHEILVGEGADRFAAECGLSGDNLLSEDRMEDWQEWVNENVDEDAQDEWPDVPLVPLMESSGFQNEKDTVVMLGQDASGGIVSAASSSGWPYKYPGRLGDSPIIGAGHYADSRFGAAACTHTGEMSIRTGASRSVVLYMKMGMSLEEACRETLADVQTLESGVLEQLVIYGIDKEGKHYACSNAQAKPYSIWTSDMKAPTKAKVAVVK